MLNQKYYKLLNVKNNSNLKLLKSNFYRDLGWPFSHEYVWIKTEYTYKNSPLIQRAVFAESLIKLDSLEFYRTSYDLDSLLFLYVSEHPVLDNATLVVFG